MIKQTLQTLWPGKQLDLPVRNPYHPASEFSPPQPSHLLRHSSSPENREEARSISLIYKQGLRGILLIVSTTMLWFPIALPGQAQTPANPTSPLFNPTLWFDDDDDDYDYWFRLCQQQYASARNTAANPIDGQPQNPEAYESALAACELAIPLDDDELEPWQYRSDILFTLERYADALVSYEQVMRMDDPTIFIMMRRCISQYHIQQYDGAIATCQQALDRHHQLTTNPDKDHPLDQEWSNPLDQYLLLPPLPTVRLSRRQRRRLRRQWRRQQEEILEQQAANLKPAYQPANAWFYIGLSHQGLRQTDEAIAAFNQAITLHPDYVEVWYQQCQLLSEQGESLEALGTCNYALWIDPARGEGEQGSRGVEEQRSREETLPRPYIAVREQAVIWAERARLLHELERYDEALVAYGEAIALNPHEADLWSGYGTLLNTLNRHEEALEAHQWAVRLTPDSTVALTHQCTTLNHLWRYDEALAACNQAIQVSDMNVGIPADLTVAWNQRGNALLGLQNYELALTAFDWAIYLTPDYADAWSNKAVALWYLEDWLPALETVETAIALGPNTALYWFNKGIILGAMERDDAALKAYETALEHGDLQLDQPILARLWVNQSASLWRLHRYDEALYAAERAIALNAAVADAWYNKALVLESLDDHEGARLAYEEAIALAPNRFEPLTLTQATEQQQK